MRIPVDVDDLVELLRIVPWTEVDADSPLWLKPTFGAHSQRVGEADCDLILGTGTHRSEGEIHAEREKRDFVDYCHHAIANTPDDVLPARRGSRIDA